MGRVYLEYLGDAIELPFGETFLGRDASCTMRFNDPSVSRRHVKFVRHPERVVVEDLGSSNGTVVNGEKLRGSRVVSDGDSVKVGSRVLTIRAPEDEDAQPSTLLLDEGGTPAQRRAFTSLASVTAPPPNQFDRRRDLRLPVELPVMYVSRELELEAISRDLSTKGVFVCTEVLDPVGTLCQLTLYVDGGPPLIVAGIVRRVVHMPTNLEVVGLGVEFVKVSAPELAWLEAVLDRASGGVTLT